MSDNIHRTLMFVEIDIDYCANTYGTSPCTAALGVTGEKRCFNTFKTCQDQPNFINEPKTLRYAEATDYIPGDIDCIPSLASINYTPQQIDPGRSMGDRASVTASFSDHPHSDTDLDKYVALRDYDPYEQGSYWSKFRARNPYIIGRNFRLIMGTDDQTLDQMETRHFIIESSSGPGTSGTFQIVAKDILKIADGDRAQAPRKSTGELLDDIDDAVTVFTLDPPGIGDLEYPASGVGSIGEEMLTFTRSGDTVTIARGQYATDPEEHKSGDLFQLALVIDGISPDRIIAGFFIFYADCPPEYIPDDEWAYEIANYVDRVYSTVIAKPTAVSDLVNELIEQVGLVFWWDDILQQIKLRSLRPVAATADLITDDQIKEGTFKSMDQPDKRASQVWISFAQLSPLEDLTRESNYASGVLAIDAQSEIDNGQPAVKKVFSRWIPRFARSTASRLGSQILSRYRNPPRQFTFSVDRFQDVPQLGRGYRLQSYPLQKDDGSPDIVTVIVQSLEPEPDIINVVAEEMFFFSQIDLETTKLIVIDQDSTNVVLRDAYNDIYSELADDEVVQVIIQHGVIVGSATPVYPGMATGDWPAGVTLNITNYGRIQGAGGGGGGLVNNNLGDGLPGGNAFLVTRPITLDNTTGQIWAGGGGGGCGLIDQYTRAGGGGGAGFVPGPLGEFIIRSNANSSIPGTAATTEAGGRGYFIDPKNDDNCHGGSGGGPGEAGTDGFNDGGYTRPGGAAGYFIIGNAFVSYVAEGDVRGHVS